MRKTWLITGVSTGLGRAFAEAALGRGDVVFGTVRKESDRASFEALGDGDAHALILDVTDEQAVKNLGENLSSVLGGGLDVLVNNAGYGVLGAFEDLSPAQIRKQMEVNFFGALNVTRAVLPHFRKSKQGTIVQISSVAGQTGTPGLSAYNASKWALEGFSEALANEVAHLGIRVILVEPGAFRTDWAGRSMDIVPTSGPYQETAGLVEQRLSNINGRQQGDPQKAAHFLLELVDMEKPPLRIPFGNDSYDRIRAKIKSQQDDLLAWEAKSRSLWFEEKEK